MRSLTYDPRHARILNTQILADPLKEAKLTQVNGLFGIQLWGTLTHFCSTEQFQAVLTVLIVFIYHLYACEYSHRQSCWHLRVW